MTPRTLRYVYLVNIVFINGINIPQWVKYACRWEGRERIECLGTDFKTKKRLFYLVHQKYTAYIVKLSQQLSSWNLSTDYNRLFFTMSVSSAGFRPGRTGVPPGAPTPKIIFLAFHQNDLQAPLFFYWTSIMYIFWKSLSSQSSSAMPQLIVLVTPSLVGTKTKLDNSGASRNMRTYRRFAFTIYMVLQCYNLTWVPVPTKCLGAPAAVVNPALSTNSFTVQRRFMVEGSEIMQ